MYEASFYCRKPFEDCRFAESQTSSWRGGSTVNNQQKDTAVLGLSGIEHVDRRRGNMEYHENSCTAVCCSHIIWPPRLWSFYACCSRFLSPPTAVPSGRLLLGWYDMFAIRLLCRGGHLEKATAVVEKMFICAVVRPDDHHFFL